MIPDESPVPTHWAFNIIHGQPMTPIFINPPHTLLSYAYKCYSGDISGRESFSKAHVIYSWEKVGDI